MKILLGFLLLISFTVHSQTQIKISAMPTYLGSPAGGYAPILVGTTNYKIDAVKFSNTKVNLADTTNMLAPYLRESAAGVIYTTLVQNALKINIADSATMLLPYLLRTDAASTYTTFANVALKLNISDTSAMLSPYYRTSTATAALALKQGNLTLTTLGSSGVATLVGNTLNIPNYATGVGGGSGDMNYTDTAAMLSPYERSAHSTAVLTGYATTTANGLKLNKTDTSSMLSPYLLESDAAILYATIDQDTLQLCSIYTSGVPLVYSNLTGDTAWFKRIASGSQTTVTQNADSSIQVDLNLLGALSDLNFPSTLAQTSSDLTISVTGAIVGDAVVLGVPIDAVNANSSYTAFVSATNTVTVRFNNYSALAINPTIGTFKVKIVR